MTEIKMKSSEYRACVDCKWFSEGDGGRACANPAYKQFDVVDGWEEQQAREIRERPDLCGPSGKGWEKNAYAPDDGKLVRYIWATLVVGLVVLMISQVFK